MHLKKYAIVTPYFREDRQVIERCMDSVRRQTVKADHILVADGFAQDWIDQTACRHLKLDQNYDDFGNTPRGIGAMLAISRGYDGIGLLDADNWLEPDHIKACIAASLTVSEACDFVIAKRTLRRVDGTILPVSAEEDHVDTNSFFFLPGSFGVIPRWALMPKQLAPLGDRYFMAMLRRQPFQSASVEWPTVNYLCLWQSFYEAIGEVPPPNAKPNVDGRAVENWLRSLSARELEIADRLTGLVFKPVASPTG